MSKKHFIKLAITLKSVRPLPGDHDNGAANPIASRAAEQAWSDAVQAVAIVCLDQNPAFQASKFFTACGGLFENNTVTHVEIDEFEARAAVEFAKCRP